MAKRKTHEEFVSEVFEIVGDEYEFLTEYKVNAKPIIAKHKKCEHSWETTPMSILNGIRKRGEVVCPNCNNLTKTTKQFKREVFDLVGDEYIVVDEYVNSYTELTMKHNIEGCMCEFTVKPDNFIRKNTRCTECHVNAKKKSHNQFVKEIESIYGENVYEFLSEYDYARIPIKTRHIECGHVWNPTPKDLLVNRYDKVCCPNCNHGAKTLNTDTFKLKIYELLNNEYVVLGEYINDKTPIKVKHNIQNCQHEYEVRPNTILHGSRCPRCNESKGEKVISNWLDSGDIKYIPQYKFEDCKYKKRLKFDFAIFDRKNNLICLIEYDGIGHFKPIDFAGKGEEWANEEFIIRKNCDQIKNVYCKDNNIKLYRIPYWLKDNIEEILDKLIHNEIVEIDEHFIVV